MNAPLSLQVIATIENDFTSKFGIPRQSGLAARQRSVIVFEPEYRDENALRGLDGYSHLWLVWGFSEVRREGWSPTVKPPKLGGNTRMGVFATRSPFRPNPVGLSSVRLEGIEKRPGKGTVLLVSGADPMNGSPIYDSIVPSMLSNLPDAMIGIVIILVLSASMSTLSSLVLTSGSTLTLDIIKPAVGKAGKDMSEKSQLLTIRLFVLFFIAVSSVLAIVQAKSSVTFIAQLMGISWGALAGAFLAPFLYGLYWKKTTRTSVAVNFVWGIGVTLVQLFVLFGVFKFAEGSVLAYLFKSSINSGVLFLRTPCFFSGE